jgi:ribosomal protein L18E
MKYYVNKDNNVFAYETVEEMQEFSKEPLTEITKEQAENLTKPTPEQLKAIQISKLKQNLLETDYKVLPDYDKPSEDIKAQRQAWRNEIRTLEG